MVPRHAEARAAPAATTPTNNTVRDRIWMDMGRLLLEVDVLLRF
jgi:hypothetical protein